MNIFTSNFVRIQWLKTTSYIFFFLVLSLDWCWVHNHCSRSNLSLFYWHRKNKGAELNVCWCVPISSQVRGGLPLPLQPLFKHLFCARPGRYCYLHLGEEWNEALEVNVKGTIQTWSDSRAPQHCKFRELENTHLLSSKTLHPVTS